MIARLSQCTAQYLTLAQVYNWKLSRVYNRLIAKLPLGEQHSNCLAGHGLASWALYRAAPELGCYTFGRHRAAPPPDLVFRSSAQPVPLYLPKPQLADRRFPCGALSDSLMDFSRRSFWHGARGC